FQAEDGIRDRNVTGVQTCALPIFIITEVLLVILASGVVISTFCPSTSSSMPNSSTNAPLVPEPSSLEQMVMGPEAPPAPSVSSRSEARRVGKGERCWCSHEG